MLNRGKDLKEIGDYHVSPVLVVKWLDYIYKFMILASAFTKSAETSLMLWLYGNDFIKRAAVFGSGRHT